MAAWEACKAIVHRVAPDDIVMVRSDGHSTEGRSGVRGWRGEKTDREIEDGRLGSGQITPPLLSLPQEANPHLPGSHATFARLLVSLLRLFLRVYLRLQWDGSKGGEQDGWPADFFEGSGAQGRRRLYHVILADELGLCGSSPMVAGKRCEMLNLGGSIDKCGSTGDGYEVLGGSEYKALLGDGAGEVEYFQSLDERIIKMKGVSDPIKCHCGLEYNVELDRDAMGAR
ncbi:hypothetical protein TRIUR3_26172 [Triticum urartu]|uniref:Uncharacterized protein n=1 Tax=Triticum urartu TaxID=4572 RepID=M7Y6T0_TRIUA|nr:hypothetical protein TRIUR3_26172 [Triticum urartu]